MAYAKEMYFSTKALYDHVMKDIPKDEDERDQYIEKIEVILNERDKLIHQFSQVQVEPNDSEKKLLEEVVKLNKLIQPRLIDIKKLIGQDIQKIKMKKAQGKKYDNPYERATSTSYFFDKKGV